MFTGPSLPGAHEQAEVKLPPSAPCPAVYAARGAPARALAHCPRLSAPLCVCISPPPRCVLLSRPSQTPGPWQPATGLFAHLGLHAGRKGRLGTGLSEMLCSLCPSVIITNLCDPNSATSGVGSPGSGHCIFLMALRSLLLTCRLEG